MPKPITIEEAIHSKIEEKAVQSGGVGIFVCALLGVINSETSEATKIGEILGRITKKIGENATTDMYLTEENFWEVLAKLRILKSTSLKDVVRIFLES